MKIDYSVEPPKYYDMNGEELHDGDVVGMNGREWSVMLAEDGSLGTDATNPKWIETGRAVPGEYGIYPFEQADEPVKVVK